LMKPPLSRTWTSTLSFGCSDLGTLIFMSKFNLYYIDNI
jgi:hypothetical protein